MLLSMWYEQLHTEGILTPVLLIHPETIAENIAEMIKVATEVTQKMTLKIFAEIIGVNFCVMHRVNKPPRQIVSKI